MGVPEGRVSNRGTCRLFQLLVPKHRPSHILSLTEPRAALSVVRGTSEPPLAFALGRLTPGLTSLPWVPFLPLPALDIVPFLPLEGPCRWPTSCPECVIYSRSASLTISPMKLSLVLPFNSLFFPLIPGTFIPESLFFNIHIYIFTLMNCVNCFKSCLFLATRRILVPRQGIEPAPPHWKHRILTSAPPGNSLLIVF